MAGEKGNARVVRERESRTGECVLGVPMKQAWVGLGGIGPKALGKKERREK